MVIDASAKRAGRAANPAFSDLPDAQATGAPAATVARGTTSFLVPYGPGIPVHVVQVNGDASMAGAVEQLFCDEVALAATQDLNESGRPALACRRGPDIYLGYLIGED
jgi:hypothetical protein